MINSNPRVDFDKDYYLVNSFKCLEKIKIETMVTKRKKRV
jgi:hypothetical protein